MSELDDLGGLGDLGELDRPGTPGSPGGWDARSEEWLTAESGPDGDRTATMADLEGDGETRSTDQPAPAAAHRTTTATPPRTAPRRSQSTPTPRRTAADPVKALMHRHRELCERAVDPLEIAAGLEAHGVTDRTATRFRHRDVFSLAEEMYARASRDGDSPPPTPPPEPPRTRADWALLTLLPGALCAATLTGIHLTDGRPRLITAAVGALAVALALRAALTRGPLSTTHPTHPRTRTLTCWLIAYALLGDGLLRQAITGGPDTLPTGTTDATWPTAGAPALALALSLAPAAWTAHLLTARARRKLTASRGLEDFAAAVHPLLLGAFALYLSTLAALLALTATALDEPAPYAQTMTLGALLYLSRLLTTHGFTHAPALVLTATATAQATALATTFASRLPGCDALGTPVTTLVDTWGPGAVPTLACGIGAATLLLHATRRLTRASAHATTDLQW
ncbi:hypothetical protein RQC66_40930 [Streptomyces justiciae]|uniref:Integral membrane protein n=1 Tax=Streptomyces justiciae TaxID=2780140 RepID=A0ABU3M6H6_9ACTN|nr:hypothetical protein [Streptomyces justiciae]MDT7847104.1 hypothetical protein [Streptomyces justiciae]